LIRITIVRASRRPHLTHRTVSRYKLALGVASRCSRVVASRSRVCSGQPCTQFASGDHRWRDLSFPYLSPAHRALAETFKPIRANADHMMPVFHTQLVSPRLAGACRPAASWCAPSDTLGRGARVEQRGHSQGIDERDPREAMKRSKSGRTSMSGYRPFDVGNSGAESRGRGRTP
jgi:hypothetical protein